MHDETGAWCAEQQVPVWESRYCRCRTCKQYRAELAAAKPQRGGQFSTIRYVRMNDGRRGRTGRASGSAYNVRSYRA